MYFIDFISHLNDKRRTIVLSKRKYNCLRKFAQIYCKLKPTDYEITCTQIPFSCCLRAHTNLLFLKRNRG